MSSQRHRYRTTAGAALPPYEGRWFKISVDVNAGNIVLDLVGALARWQVPFFFGSMHIKLTSDQHAELKATFPDPLVVELTEDQNLSDKAQLVVEDNWDIKDTDIDLFKLAMTKSREDEQSDEKFAAEFLSLFHTDKRGSLRMHKKLHVAVKLFAVRFAHKIKVLSGGLQPLVPRFSNDPNRNKLEMFRLFVSAYPAYCNLTKSAGWDNKFFWTYAITEDEENTEAEDRGVKRDGEELDRDHEGKRQKLAPAA